MVAIGSGQASIGTNGTAEDLAIQQGKGAPVAIKYLDLVPVDGAELLLLTDAPS